MNRVDSTGSLVDLDNHSPLNNSHTSIERNGGSPNSQAVTRRSQGLNWYLTTLRDLIRGGFGWVRNSVPEAPRAGEVQANVTKLTQRVSQVADRCITRIKTALNPADFFPLLNRTQVETIFSSAEMHQTQTYETKLSKYREVIKGGSIDSLNKDTAVRIFRGLGLGPADRILGPYLPDAPDEPDVFLSSLLKADREAIRKVTPEIGEGWMTWGFTKLLGNVRLFDPMKDGNFPFLIGTRTIEGKEVNVLRHPIPTVEFGSIQIAPEYKAFLEYLKSQETSVLYDSLLHLPGQVSISSGDRKNLLYDLQKEYPDVFHFVRMPFDGPLSKVAEYRTLENYRDSVKTELYNGVNSPGSSSNEFVFGSKKMIDIVDRHYDKIVNFAYNQILSVYPGTGEEEISPAMILLPKEKEKKQVFMMLVQTLLRSVLIKELGVGYYNNTCKHASDRGSAATGCDLILSHLLTGTLKDHLMDLRLTAAWPAFMAKSSAVEEGRAEWLDAFARFAETAIAQNKREELVTAYEEAGFPIEGKMSYYRPKIYYPQKGEEVHKIIIAQNAERNFSLDIPFDPQDPEAQVLDKLLEAFESQYSLSFTRVGKEGLKAVTSEKQDYYLVKDRFVVCDVEGEEYGELTFSIEFPAEDPQGTVLHAKIQSELRVLDPSIGKSNGGTEDGHVIYG